MVTLDNLVVAEELVKFFGDIPALQGINLEVPKGICGFIGPNGAGKTTTLNILVGLLKPDGGKAFVFGLDSWSESFEIRRRLGVLREKPSYPSNFTGGRYLEHVAHIYGISQPKQRAKETLEDVGLSDAEERAINTYSAGMTQRLGLAQALIGNPELVILDEPTANLDPLGRIEFLGKIKELHEKNRINFLISSHVLPELEKICGWVAIINSGMIVDHGSLDCLAERYSANVYEIVVSNPTLFADRVKQLEMIDKVWVEDNVVYCQVLDTGSFCKEVPRLVSELNLQLKSFQYSRNILEEIFKIVLEGNRSEA